ncbi:Na+/H+ antiporter NhaA [Hymenobacter actinosclerus]|uniref:Na(+)/H(+) antiporter NhaA n=1 Tax=Hymenobacter actinosclerus TaxID=82805 RepID=A0A1I0DW20_9BACT|nr:Na+/H+ antiporter NhaA [Hymenobacter actinosclerus]SET36545.1 sodium/proton antiporter, NhaA family [Hymenobacter actinosclerus]
MPAPRFLRPLTRPFIRFFRHEAASGFLLLASTALALVLANSSWGVAHHFPAIWSEHLRITVHNLVLDHTLLHWINDGLMTVFFLLVGLEMKREVLGGELTSLRQAALPLAGAAGGIVVPALLFTALNYGTATANGWAIPMATDIAFALAVLQLLGPRVPLGLKVFLTALAIVDDLAAVVVIAGFYTSTLHLSYVYLALGTWGVLLLFNWLQLRSLWAYLPLGLLLTFFMLESGIHTTLAGVLLAVAIPFRAAYPRPAMLRHLRHRLGRLGAATRRPEADPHDIGAALEVLGSGSGSPARRLEGKLHAVVAFGVIPLFAFANSSLVIAPAAVRGLLSPLGLGIVLGLLVGKPLGIGALSWLSVRLGWATLPPGVSWRHVWGAGILAGIGFTMSIFITLLALGLHSPATDTAKLAVLLASALASSLGYALLRSTLKPPAEAARAAPASPGQPAG